MLIKWYLLVAINFTNATFVKSAPSLKDAPQGLFPEVLLVGKSNVGKSSLINALCNKKGLAFTSSKPGHTRLLNYYNIDNKIYLVDAPGYGFAKGGFDLDKLFGEMMNDYFSNATRLKLVMILLDSRRELGENDIEEINYLVGKKYSSCTVKELTDLEEDRTIPYFNVNVDGTEYDSKSMGCGEHFLFYLFWNRRTVLKFTIILLFKNFI